MTDLSVLYAALATPYADDEAVSEPCLRRLVEFVHRQGVGGLYVGGSTGESLLQTTEERRRALRIAADAGGGRMRLIGHVGSVATRDAQALARTCAEAGYDAVSAIPPIYFPQTQGGIRAYYEAIVDAAGGLPVVVYNIPAMSGVTFGWTALCELLTLPGIVGLKQTAIDMYQMERLRRSFPDMLLLNGYDEMILAGLVSGADGAIGSTFNIMGWRYRELRAALEAGRVAEARRLQSRCNAVIDVLVEHGVFPSIKYMLHRMGVVASPRCRAPLGRIDPAAAGPLDTLANTLMRENPATL